MPPDPLDCTLLLSENNSVPSPPPFLNSCNVLFHRALQLRYQVHPGIIHCSQASALRQLISFINHVDQALLTSVLEQRQQLVVFVQLPLVGTIPANKPLVWKSLDIVPTPSGFLGTNYSHYRDNSLFFPHWVETVGGGNPEQLFAIDHGFLTVRIHALFTPFNWWGSGHR